jgi:hypothetical protein
MRSLQAFAIFGSLVLAGSVSAQSLAEHAAAAAGATVGTAAGKPISNALTKIFGQADHATATAAGAKQTKTVKPIVVSHQNSGTPSAGASGGGALATSGAAIERSHAARPSRSQAAPVRAAIEFTAPVQASVIEPPRREPTIEELAGIQVGTTHSALHAALGAPASEVTSPDDDGHLRQSCQYWANGRQIGTVRLDNGQVVKVEIYSQN